MKILTLFDRYPYPLSNGQNLRVFHYARHLSQHHELDLVCYGHGASPEPIQDFFRRIEVYAPPDRSPASRRLLMRLWRSFSLKQMVPVSESAQQHIANILRERHYDVLWVGGTNMLMLLPDNHSTPVLLDDCDHSMIKQLRELRMVLHPLNWLRAAKRTLMLYLLERRLHRRAQAALYVSELDAEMFCRICPGVRVSVIQNGVDVEFFKPLDGPIEPFDLVFEGNMSFEPNVDAVLYFHEQILPLIWKQVPEVRFLVVGKDPTPAIRQLAGALVEVTGFVEDVRPYLDRAALFVCPMRLGAGIKNKILQAWAMGKAVVATNASMGGLTGLDGENVLIRDNPAAFADAVISLLSNPEQRQALGAQGRRTILQGYTWERQSEHLERLMVEVATSHSLCPRSSNDFIK